MNRFSGKQLSVVFSAIVLAIGGCSKGDSSKGGPMPAKVVVTKTSTDLRTLSAIEVAARIKKHRGGEFANVLLDSDGPNQFAGTATTSEGKTIPLKVTVTEDEIEYKAESSDGIIFGTIKESSKSIQGSFTIP